MDRGDGDELRLLEERIHRDEEYDIVKYYDEVDIKDFVYDAANRIFTFPCPCGDQFEISVEELLNGEEIAMCPSCPLIIKVVYEEEDINRARKTASLGAELLHC
ncbi:UNVERIFIED_CONTAM: hypothetical protein PYX00_011819 [Menopon gallinae]|uniref:Diphthamide biosynthesis protein 3 n=1 Tax=Menopon gallinae TaxID=328185 RepID=A0AAW2H992_9NEOP